MRNIFKYFKTVILIDQFSRDTKNDYLLISQRPYRGKTDADSNIILESGATVSLQIMHDISDPIVNKKTGKFWKIGDFLQNYSYYIDGKLYLRFSKIEQIKKGKE